MSSSKYNVTLTNYARGLSQDISATLAGPEKGVGTLHGYMNQEDTRSNAQL